MTPPYKIKAPLSWLHPSENAILYTFSLGFNSHFLKVKMSSCRQEDVRDFSSDRLLETLHDYWDRKQKNNYQEVIRCCIWIALGSPVNNKGRFKECFEDPEWETKTIDGRDSSLACKGFVENAIKDYGLNSDFVKIRVLGQFT